VAIGVDLWLFTHQRVHVAVAEVRWHGLPRHFRPLAISANLGYDQLDHPM